MSDTPTPIQAGEYYSQLLSLLHSSQSDRLEQLRFLLKRFCYELTHEADTLFSNLYARIDYMCQQHGVGADIVRHLNHLRITTRHENSEEIPISEWQGVIKEFAEAIEAFTGVAQPNEFALISIPKHRATPLNGAERWIEIRATVSKLEGKTIWVTPHNNECPSPVQLVVKSHREDQLFADSLLCLREGMQINLIESHYSAQTNTLYAEILVLEPDFLLDISLIAECFKEYGTHPLNLLISRLQPDENSRHMLLGNIANQFLDDLINQSETEPATYQGCMRKAFQHSPLSLAACNDLESSETERAFFEECERQFYHLKTVVEQQFKQQKIDPKMALLEPSFICEKLGIQGRLDLLQEDFSTFIELKSGKALEQKSNNTISHRENHYVQMMLYYAILHYNLGVEANQVHAYLLYSRYPQLYHMPPYFALVKQAINLRNRMVAIEHAIQQQNNLGYTLRILQAATPERLNEAKLDNRLWHLYYSKPIDTLQRQLHALTPLARDYVAALYTFITKEQYLAKAGDGNFHSAHGAASLWNSTAAEKIESGEMMANLQLLRNEIGGSAQTLELQLAPRTDAMVPNFRTGDMVVLYHREQAHQNACNQQVFKGTIAQMDGQRVTVRLRYIQRNPNLLTQGGVYALEHDYTDMGFSIMYRSIGYLLKSNPERRQLLLGERPPRFDSQQYAQQLPQEATPLQEIVARAIAAQDYFLLVGPPGTGKTSQALRLMVESYLSMAQSNILLIAYTNKAVDEICQMLESITTRPNYIRIGQESACDELYKPHLLPEVMQSCHKRNEVKQKLQSCRIVVATLTTLASRMELFDLKQFDVAMVDEASQILEPQLLGVLSATNRSGECVINKFILIGDHKQLPAIVLQQESESKIEHPELQAIGIENLRESLFERLLRQQQLHPCTPALYGTLAQQGRMHPDVAQFAADHFYGGDLTAIPLPHQREQLPEVCLSEPLFARQLLGCRMAFVATAANPTAASSFKVNSQEAKVVAEICHWVYLECQLQGQPFVANTQLGVITPYRSQIAAIKRELERFGVAELNQVTVDTVERFQGGQRNTMIYSCCVNTPFQLQFLSNIVVENGIKIDRKLNVALTRARKQLFILGCPQMLSLDPIYQKLIAHTQQNSSYFVLDSVVYSK